MMGSCFCGVDKDAFAERFNIKPVNFEDGVRGKVKDMSWTWYVRLGNEIVGTVIATNADDALEIARKQYKGFDFEPVTVQRRSLKRKK